MKFPAIQFFPSALLSAKAMQDYKKVHNQSEGNNEGLGRRLFNYIVNALFPRRSKHTELANHKLVIGEMPVVEGPSESKIHSRGSNLVGEIEIEFRHTEIEEEMWSNALHKDENGENRKSMNGDFQVPVSKKSVEIRGPAGKSEGPGKLKQIDNEEMKTTDAGHSRPVSRVTSNNGNAIDEFLKSRKEAMRRYYSMDQKEKR